MDAPLNISSALTVAWIDGACIPLRCFHALDHFLRPQGRVSRVHRVAGETGEGHNCAVEHARRVRHHVGSGGIGRAEHRCSTISMLISIINT